MKHYTKGSLVRLLMDYDDRESCDCMWHTKVQLAGHIRFTKQSPFPDTFAVDPIPPRQVLQLAIGIAKGLEKLHQLKVIYDDLKVGPGWLEPCSLETKELKKETVLP